MKKDKPKISFTTGPASDVVRSAPAEGQSRAQMKAAPAAGKSTVMPKSHDASKPLGAGATSGLSSSTPKRHSAPLIAQAAPRSMFTPVLAVVSILTVGLGVAAVFLWQDDNLQAETLPARASEQTKVTAQGVSEPASLDSVTRAATPDLTDLANRDQTGKAAGGSVVANLAAAVQVVMYPAENPAVVMQQAPVAEEAVDLVAEEMQVLRAGILAGDYEIDVVEQNGVGRSLLRFVGAEETGNAAKAVLMQAIAEGRITAPKHMWTPEGPVDIDTLMFDLVQTALAADGTVEGADAARDMSRTTFMASRIQSSKVDGKRHYTVGAGDSLAYISLQFYGKPDAFQRIVDANRKTLQSPEKIQIGQRLIIPS